ncbi:MULTISPECIES: carbonic anhydrase [Rhodopseudomonas]|uniref:Carbonic anhydrase n=1 Tax=Rhodopseudomonas palustris TaxID=1076 RepID=A0A0D7EA29_RHOPL|nr:MULTISPECIES: carbonic anhydrase [Rhodopseudomonas]KIZ37486.1 carbonate dehydratase [Rhodopseudomonas palustris]MDF3811121.1 carbonic anhydrase [Rhodopseudomonas sp. BAL398]WOK17041.1 carbonic anhydrase [Rhodopseudomonas sp. BAL398]
MNRRHALKALAGLALCPICASAGLAAETAHHWGYDGEGGPAKWGELDAANQVCSVGSQQSPIDIGATVQANLFPIEINWADKADTIVNNGHTIQLNFAEGSSTLKLGAVKFALLQLHFHHPSEHMIDGKNFPMEAHFVHRSPSGGLGVLGVLFEAGKANATLHKIVATMPDHAGPAVKADAAINPNALLPEKLSYFRYEGSLTTPPCSEIVDWMVLTHPVAVAKEDIAAFAKLYPMNARPAQKDNRRFVLQSN